MEKKLFFYFPVKTGAPCRHTARRVKCRMEMHSEEGGLRGSTSGGGRRAASWLCPEHLPEVKQIPRGGSSAWPLLGQNSI